MIENRKALAALIGYIIGIIMGLYCKISIVLFYMVYFLLSFIFKKEKQNTKFRLFSWKRYFRYIKIIFNKKVMKIILLFSCLSNTIVLFQNYQYDTLYQNIEEQNYQFVRSDFSWGRESISSKDKKQKI